MDAKDPNAERPISPEAAAPTPWTDVTERLAEGNICDRAPGCPTAPGDGLDLHQRFDVRSIRPLGGRRVDEAV
jgi:hypothetical protein